MNAPHIDNLVTVSLYHLSSRRSTDAVFLRILMALLVLCEASPSLTAAINNHTLSPNINELLAIYSTKGTDSSTSSSTPPAAAAAEVVEIRSLLCLFNALLFMAEGGNDEEENTVGKGSHEEEANRL